MTDENKTRIYWLDFIRVLCIFLVILIHVSSPIVNAWDDLSTFDWMVGNIFDSFARFSVPLLFMVSGYLLLSRKEGIKVFYVSRVRKVVVPLLIWSVIYLIWRQDYSSYTFFNSIKAIIYEILREPVYFHLWFLYVLLVIYLFVPIMRVFVQNADKSTLWYFVWVWVAFGPMLDVFEKIFDINIAIDLGFVARYIGYFYLGYVLGRLSLEKWTIRLSVLVFVVSVFYTVIATYQASNANGDYVDLYHGYFSVNVVFMSLSAFICLKALGEKIGAQAGEISIKLTRAASDASFGIYLIHAMILILFRKGDFGFELSGLSGTPLIMAPVTSLTVFFASWALVVILQKIPFLRAIVPR